MDKDNKTIGNVAGLMTKVSKAITNLQHKVRSQPGKNLNLIAVTGSAGKTTTAHILYELFKAVGVNVAAITSQGVFLGQQQINTIPVDNMTGSQLFEALAFLEKSKASLVILETPVSLIERHVTDPLVFQATILTNMLVEDPVNDPRAEVIFSPVLNTKEKGLVILNGDDDNIKWISTRAESITQKLFAAWCKQDQVQNLVVTPSGSAFTIGEQSYSTTFVGDVNLSNTLLALRFALQYLKPAQIASILHRIPQLPGKLELVNDLPFPIIIDEGTTPLVYSKVVSSVRALMTGDSKLITIVGADSEDDSVIGFIAALNSRIMIVAPQNTTQDDLTAVNNALITAAEQKSGVLVERFNSAEEFNVIDKEKLQLKIDRVIENGDVPIIVFDEPNAAIRTSAIQFALSIATDADCVFISGMGAKSELKLAGVYYQWSEKEVINQVLSDAVPNPIDDTTS